MGVILNNQSMDMPYLNGIKMNAYLNGQIVWSSAPTPPQPLPEDMDIVTITTIPGTDTMDLTITSVENTKNGYIEIDWGDGNKENVSTVGVISHTYSDPSVAYDIIIKG